MPTFEIPPFTPSGVLPPFISDVTKEATMSPYRTTLVKMVERFGTSPRRLTILSGLLELREALRGIGIVQGFHWIDGSFVEDVEKTASRAPHDIDVVTFFRRPAHLKKDHPAWKTFSAANQHLFRSEATKLSFDCDAHYVDLDSLETIPEELIKRTRYYFGLFSHKRTSFLWKGMLEVSLGDPSDDAAAKTKIQQGTTA